MTRFFSAPVCLLASAPPDVPQNYKGHELLCDKRFVTVKGAGILLDTFHVKLVHGYCIRAIMENASQNDMGLENNVKDHTMECFRERFSFQVP